MHPLRKALGTICDHCPLCNYARRHPGGRLEKYYEWHGKWCPAWQAQKEIEAAREAARRTDGSGQGK
jgi:hypothetical protein